MRFHKITDKHTTSPLPDKTKPPRIGIIPALMQNQYFKVGTPLTIMSVMALMMVFNEPSRYVDEILTSREFNDLIEKMYIGSKTIPASDRAVGFAAQQFGKSLAALIRTVPNEFTQLLADLFVVVTKHIWSTHFSLIDSIIAGIIVPCSLCSDP